MIETANGMVRARSGRVASLAVGPLRTSDLGVVISPQFDDLDVLGMNFLSRLKSWRVEDRVLVLEPGDAAGGSNVRDATGTPPDSDNSGEQGADSSSRIPE